MSTLMDIYLARRSGTLPTLAEPPLTKPPNRAPITVAVGSPPRSLGFLRSPPVPADEIFATIKEYQRVYREILSPDMEEWYPEVEALLNKINGYTLSPEEEDVYNYLAAVEKKHKTVVVFALRDMRWGKKVDVQRIKRDIAEEVRLDAELEKREKWHVDQKVRRYETRRMGHPAYEVSLEQNLEERQKIQFPGFSQAKLQTLKNDLREAGLLPSIEKREETGLRPLIENREEETGLLPFTEKREEETVAEKEKPIPQGEQPKRNRKRKSKAKRERTKRQAAAAAAASAIKAESASIDLTTTNVLSN